MLGILIKNPGKRLRNSKKPQGFKGVCSKFKKVSIIQKVGTKSEDVLEYLLNYFTKMVH